MVSTSTTRVVGARPFLVGMFVDALGNGLYLPLTLLFIHEVTGLPMTTVGLGVTVAAVVGLAANPVAGILIDRFDARRVLMATYVLRAVAFAAYPLVDGFVSLIAVAAVVAVGDRAYYPASGSYISVLAEGAARDRLYTLIATARNAAFGLGGLLSAGVVSIAGATGFAIIALVNAASFAVATACLVLSGRRAPAAPPGRPGGYREVFADRPFVGLVVAEQAYTLIHVILPVAMPVYAVTVLGVSPALLGVLYAINTVLVAAGQLPVRRWQRHSRRTHAMALSGLIMMLACAAYAATALLPAGPARVAGLLVATLVLTLGELTHTTPGWALAAAAAPPALRGRYLAIYQQTWAVAAVVAPAGFSAILGAAPAMLWVTLAVLVGLAALALLRLSRRLPPGAVAAPGA
ncbi:Predicted arabinose efflux permease, MFS family [Nonomuraea solani]|uniref:Predicted arabinose efflux permease, MFS family n=1 Tax=Nonomuraea solani TaxID=1144553 RepID=A0A1H6E8C7_9ACTN|nr:MFS transporter [Nonomuraea solani]SEG93982.1 Predicted arabinose efflux permease, MFS family [Nonomuraea solani]